MALESVPRSGDQIRTSYPPGTVVVNRRRLWRVDGQTDQVLYATTIDGGDPRQARFYLPFEDVHPGRLPLPDAQTVGVPATQDLLLRAYRLGLIHGTAPLLSLQRSRVIPKDYQLVPVVMALEAPRVRLLLADDVGLGKTIEAGLILTELLSRQLASRVLIIVPANLREQWQETLDHFFHLPVPIISARHRREMERQLPAGANPWEHFRFLIVSVDYAKTPAIKNQILEQSWDVVLFDEAHQVAKPHQLGPEQRVRMERWQLAEELARSSRVRHLLLLTATPHNGYTDSFASLIRLLDVGAITGAPDQPLIDRRIARGHVCQRRRRDVEEWFHQAGQSPFPVRDQQEIIVSPSQYEREAIRAVEEYGRGVLEQAAGGSAQVRALASWSVLHLHKRGLSSPEALRCSLRNRRRSLLARLERQEVEEELTIAPEAARATVLDEEPDERLDEEEASSRTERFVYGSPAALRAELEHLDGILARAEAVTPRRDSKLQKLLDATLDDLMRQEPKAIVFTHYVDTMNYLAGQLRRDPRYRGVDVLTIYGSLDERERREVFRRFERADRAVLVATDAISEGINLQRAAGQVVHYELPWNPNRLEQRNGRVDRFGQPRDTVRIRLMVMDETLDASILERLVLKARQIREDYGFSPPYFGDQAEVLQLIGAHRPRLAPTQLPLFAAAAPEAGRPELDPFARETLDRIKNDSYYGQTDVTLPEIERRLRETERSVGSPAQIQSFMLSALQRFGCAVTAVADHTWRIAVTHPALASGAVSRVIERAAFDPELGLADPDVTVLDLGHPLVRRLVEEVKQDAFRPGDHYGRTAAMVTPAVSEVTAVYHLLVRYVVNTSPLSLLEELLPVALPVYGGPPLAREAVARLLEARPCPETRTEAEVREALAEALGSPELEPALTAAVEARRQTLAAERRTIRQRAEASGREAAAWLNGLDELTPGSYDLLTVTILYPGRKR